MEEYKVDLIAVKKQKTIQDYLQKVMDLNPQYYYAPSADVARVVDEMIKKDLSRMSLEDQMMLKDMTNKDIEAILGLSSCC